ncbi:phospholipase DDHD2-like isoform X2 [Mytilus californianus]|uniref:phospholipase DDHD2-like isoform X2 n=1 Tax=Mytilus californianus TaxID=6549 RepID=UPI0022469942|nr:phospholipase DDHD2-like isoform X2 [Mytilus californianus]
MADRGNKDSTPPPLLLMPAGGGLTLNPPDNQNLLMPVVQSEPSLLDSGTTSQDESNTDDQEEEGEADSFVGQVPEPSNNPFQNVGGSDPFANVGHNPFPTKQIPSSIPQRFNTQTPPQRSSPGPGGQMGTPGQFPGMGTPGQLPGMGTPGQISGFGTPGQIPRHGGPPSAGSTPKNAFRRQDAGKMKYAMPPETLTPVPNMFQQPPGAQRFPGPTSNPLPPSPFTPPVAQVAPTMSTSSGYNVEFQGGFNGQQQPGFNGQQPSGYYSSSQPAPYNTGDQGIYQPVTPHWCYSKRVELKECWYTFSLVDSIKLEEAYNSGNDTIDIPTDGGRYDVNISQRTKKAVYWDDMPSSVRRCTWFFKRESDSRYVPYEEQFAQQIENEYRNAVLNNTWHKRLEFPGGETIVMHNANVIVHFTASSQPDEWGMVQGEGMRPRVVKRGVEDFATIEDGEPSQVDHVVFVVHGIGKFCDVKFRNIVECVDDFRSISLELQKSHFRKYKDENRIGRVEFLPVLWHSVLHGDATGVDQRLKAITLPSTQKLRNFVNDTLMDILFYTSPVYAQCIADTVGTEMNRLYQLFCNRNPSFQGAVSVAGHSLGCCVLFDLLLHQKDEDIEETHTQDQYAPPTQPEVIQPVETLNGEVEEDTEEESEMTLEDLLAKVGLKEKVQVFKDEQIDMEALTMCSESDLKDLGLPMGPRKKLQGILKEEQQKKINKKQSADKKKKSEEERRIRQQIEQEMHKQQEASQQSNPHRSSSMTVDYLLGSAGTGQPSVKYPQLDFQPNSLFAFGSPIGIFLSARGVQNIGEDFKLPTCPRVFNVFHPFDPVAYRLEPLVNAFTSGVKPVLIPHHKGRKRLHLELKESLTRVGADIKHKIMESLKSTWNSINEFAKAHKSSQLSLEEQVDSQMSSVMHDLDDDKSDTASQVSNYEDDMVVGQLNEGRRIDYVLQERPIESFNDYIFALTSHGCYWESEDTVLLVLREIYGPLGMMPQMPGPDSSKNSFPSGPPQLPLYNKPQSGVGPPPQFTQAVPPMGHTTSVPLMSAGLPQSHDDRRMSAPPPPSHHFGPPPMQGFLKK